MRIVSIFRQHYLLICLLVLGAFLRLYHLDFQSVWLDEINTLNDANPDFSLAEVFASVAKYDLHPPLYFFVIHFLFKILGYSALVARLFSAVAGIAAIFAIYRLGKELFGRQVGLVAAALLCVNAYQIYYSQEARPYMMFCLFSILSFLYLARFVKMPTRRNAVWYGVFTALMLYGHLFGFFTLVGQMAVVLFFIVVSKPEQREQFLVNAAIAGAVAFVLFIPSAKSIYAATLVKEFWIPKPTADTYFLILNEFFGSQTIVFWMSGFVALYFVAIVKARKAALDRESIAANQMVFGGIILLSWIVFTVLLPVIRSYMATPIIIGRYFINILPAVFLMAAVGICQIRAQSLKVVLISVFVVVSLADLFVGRKYYTTVTKTQFCELTPLINAQNHEPIATSLAWYFGYFLKDQQIVDANLDTYVGQMIADPNKMTSFWYVDAHGRPYHAKAATQQFLDKHFVMTNELEKHDIWARHYELKTVRPQKPINTDTKLQAK